MPLPGANLARTVRVMVKGGVPMERTGKMTIDVWFFLPETDEVRAKVSDEVAGQIVMQDIADALKAIGQFGGLFGLSAPPISALEITSAATEVTPEEQAAFDGRSRAEEERIAAAMAEDYQPSVTVPTGVPAGWGMV